MSYAALMVYVEAYATPEQRVRLATDLAERFDAQLFGLSALAIPPPSVADGMVLADPTEVDIKLMQATLAEKGVVWSSRGWRFAKDRMAFRARFSHRCARAGGTLC
jgi:hypothetical protein